MIDKTPHRLEASISADERKYIVIHSPQSAARLTAPHSPQSMNDRRGASVSVRNISIGRARNADSFAIHGGIRNCTHFYRLARSRKPPKRNDDEPTLRCHCGFAICKSRLAALRAANCFFEADDGIQPWDWECRP